MSIDGSFSVKKQQKMPMDFKETFRYHDRIKELKKNFNYCINNLPNNNPDVTDKFYQSNYKVFNPQL